jgi:hypothetical protein
MAAVPIGITAAAKGSPPVTGRNARPAEVCGPQQKLESEEWGTHQGGRGKLECGMRPGTRLLSAWRRRRAGLWVHHLCCWTWSPASSPAIRSLALEAQVGPGLRGGGGGNARAKLHARDRDAAAGEPRSLPRGQQPACGRGSSGRGPGRGAALRPGALTACPSRSGSRTCTGTASPSGFF